MDYPGSGKSTLAEPFAKLVNGVWINADQVREKYNDWDFSRGKNTQAQRMRHLADGVVRAGGIAVADFVCPTEQARKESMLIMLYGWIQLKRVSMRIQIRCLKQSYRCRLSRCKMVLMIHICN